MSKVSASEFKYYKIYRQVQEVILYNDWGGRIRPAPVVRHLTGCEGEVSK